MVHIGSGSPYRYVDQICLLPSPYGSLDTHPTVDSAGIKKIMIALRHSENENIMSGIVVT